MKTFKQFLLEEFREKCSDGIWLNPSKDEIADIPQGVRAIASKDGNLLVINRTLSFRQTVRIKDMPGLEFGSGSHQVILTIGKKLYNDKRIKLPFKLSEQNSYLEAVSLIRDKNTKAFYVANDEWRRVERKIEKDNLDEEKIHKIRKNILKKTKQNNKNWVFLYKTIT